MSLIPLLQHEQIAVIADNERKNVMLELNSSGYRPRFVTVHLKTEAEIDELMEALSKAKAYLK